MTAASFGPDASTARRVIYIAVLGALTAVAPLTVDLYLPAFPALAGEFGVSSSAVQLTLTGTLLGLGLGQLVIGPLSDAFGRRWPLVISVAVHVLASLSIVAVTDIGSMTVLRIVQGAASSGGIVIATASIRDLYTGRRMSQILAQLALVSGLGPVLAPSIGALILQVTHWRGMFLWLSGFSAVLLVVVLIVIKETLPDEHRSEGRSLSIAFSRYSRLLRDREFVGLTLVGSLMKGGQFAYIAWSSFVFQSHFGLDAGAFAFVFAVNAIGTIVGAQIAAQLVRWLDLRQILAISLGTAMTTAGALAICVFAVPAAPWFVVALLLALFMVSIGLNNPTVPSLALSHHAREAGTAAALLGAVNFAFAGLAGPISGALTRNPLFALSGSLVACSAAAIVVLVFVVKGGPRGVRTIRYRPAE
ncbi:MAG: rane transport protein [Rhodoglobus sp.]|nr:rane transport protein [Rhodoglobus sp.]